MRRVSGVLLVVVALCVSSCQSSQPPAEAERPALPADQAKAAAPAAVTDACGLVSLGSTTFACLLPSSDPRHDASKRVAAGHDCFWQFKAPIDKRVSATASGFDVSYTFNVYNKCASSDVDIELQSPPGTLSSWYCPYDDMYVARGGDNRITCYANHAPGDSTLTRDYTLRVVKVNGALVAPVELDPEIVLERAGAERAIRLFKPLPIR